MSSQTPACEHLGFVRLLALTCSTLAMQLFWSTIASQTSPFLQMLSLPKTAIACVLVAQPLAGSILSPLLGACMDLSHHRWGRRTPLIMGGAIALALFLIIIALSPAWASPGNIYTPFDTNTTSKPATPRLVQVLAVLVVVGLGWSIQPVQIGLRCLVVDKTPPHQHPVVGAWLNLMTGTGAIAAFLLGSLDLEHSATSASSMGALPALSLVTACAIGLTVAITIFYAQEWKDRFDRSGAPRVPLSRVIGHLRATSDGLPEAARIVYRVQAWSWMAWFPLLFYTTTFVSELALRERSMSMETWSLQQNQASVRLGSTASLASAIVSLISSGIVPAAVISANRKNAGRQHLNDAASLDSLFRLWSFSQACTATLLFSTLVANTASQGIAIIALSGVPWVIGQWVPYTIISCQATRRPASDRLPDRPSTDMTGATFGLYNAVISMPQIIASLACVVVYAFAESAGSSIPTSWVLSLSGLAALRSSVLAHDSIRDL